MDQHFLNKNCDDDLDPSENAVKVYLRFRPSWLDEQSCANCFVIDNDVDLTVEPPSDTYAYRSSQRVSTFEQTHRFKFTRIFNEHIDQNALYENSIFPTVKHFLDGYNCLVFTYGVTNSGKTFTLVGDCDHPGLLHNTLSTIFATIHPDSVSAVPHYKPEYFNGVVHTPSSTIKDMNKMKQELLSVNTNSAAATSILHSKHSTSNISLQNQTSTLSNKLLDCVDDNIPTTYFIYVSAAEIYNEKIFDLLNTKLINKLKPTLKKSPLSIGTDVNGFSYIKDLTFVLVKDIEEALNVLKAGTIQREVAMTNLNMQSSRSHVIYGLKLVKVHHLPNEIVTKSHEMCFVDLAGSERPSKAHNEGPRFKEASNINLSLLVLGKCIEVLRQNKKSASSAIVPFRESKLTRLLQPFFLSHSNINLFANIGTNLDCFDETLNVLRFSALTMEALTRPMTISLMEMNISNCNSILAGTTYAGNTPDYQAMNSSELIQQIRYLRKNVEMLQSEKHMIEVKIRRECFEESSEMMKSIENKYKKHLISTKNNIIELYKNKLVRLEEYYKELLDEKLNETTKEQNSLLVSLEAELQRKTSEANKLKQQYSNKLEEITNKDSSTQQLHLQEIDSLNKKICQLEDVICDKQNQITEYLLKLDLNNNRIADLENELETIKYQLIEKMTELEAKIEDHAKLTLEISSLHSIIGENEDKLSKLENRSVIDDPMYIELNKQVCELKEKLITCESTVDRYTRKIERNNTRIKLLRDEVQFKEETIRKLRKENFGLKDEISMITAKLQNKAFKNDRSMNDTTINNVSTVCFEATSTTVVTPVKKSTPNKLPSNPSNSISPHSHNRSTNTPTTEVSIRVDSPSEMSFRRLYEEAREYAYRMEQRVRELQIENLPSIPKTRRSIKRHISNVKDCDKNIKEKKKVLAAATTDTTQPNITSFIINNSSKSTHLTGCDVAEGGTSTPTNILNDNREVNPSMVFRIDSTSPQSRKQATRDYVKRLKGHDMITKENDQSIVSNVKKKLNLI